MSATEAENIRRVVANVLAKDRASRGLPPIEPAEQEALDLLAIAKAARRR